MTKLNLEDTTKDIIIKMSEGNPGAMTAIMDIFQNGTKIDPDDLFGMGSILMLDTFGIYGSNIYILWNDVCKKNTRDLILLTRACQLGFLSDKILQQKSKEDYSSFTEEEWNDMNEKVCNRLPNFKK